MLQVDSKRECVALYPLMLFSSFVSVASVKTDKEKASSDLAPSTGTCSVFLKEQQCRQQEKDPQMCEKYNARGEEREMEMKAGDGLKSEKQQRYRKQTWKMQIAKYVGSAVPFYQRHSALSCSSAQSIPQTLFLVGRWQIGLEFWTDHQGSDMK